MYEICRIQSRKINPSSRFIMLSREAASYDKEMRDGRNKINGSLML